MVSPKLSDSREGEAGINDEGGGSDAHYMETIELLEEEVARLEQELRWRDRTSSEATSSGSASTRDEIADAAAEEVAIARAEIARLEAELAGREETISLLLDQLSRVEEAQAAGRAEWEQLAGWLSELEHRVEGQDGERTASDSGADSEVIEALRSENLRLRAACEELAKRPDAGPVETRDAQRDEALKERDMLRRQLEHLQDERKREHLEQKATLAELQAQLSRASLARPEPPAPETEKGSRESNAELRIRALRQHLLEIHQREEQERKQKQLIPRLARLWSRTAPR